jgi:hypothetical protein
MVRGSGQARQLEVGNIDPTSIKAWEAPTPSDSEMISLMIGLVKQQNIINRQERLAGESLADPDVALDQGPTLLHEAPPLKDELRTVSEGAIALDAFRPATLDRRAA